MSVSAREYLLAIYAEKKRKNAAYSLRAFSRDLKISHAYLSRILSGKRTPSLLASVNLAERLKLSPVERKAFLQGVTASLAEQRSASLTVSRSGRGKAHILDADRFLVLEEWYHLPILELMEMKGFVPDVGWISERLGVPKLNIREAVKRLVRVGLLEIEGENWKKTHADVFVPTTRSHAAVRSYHRQMVEKAMEHLSSSEATDFQARDMTSTTMLLDVAQLTKAKTRLRNFRRSLPRVVAQGQPTQLYQLNIQFFPLTKERPQ